MLARLINVSCALVTAGALTACGPGDEPRVATVPLASVTLPSPGPAAVGPAGLTGFIYHLGRDQARSSPPAPADIAAQVARIAKLTPSGSFAYAQTGNTLTIGMTGGDSTPTQTYLGAGAAGTADSNALATTAIDFVGAVYFPQAGTYTFTLSSADDGAAVYLGGTGVPGSGTLVAQMNYAGALNNGGQTTVTQPGWYAFELFWYNQYFASGVGGASLRFTATGPAPVRFTAAPRPTATAGTTAGLTARVYHRGTDASSSNPPNAAALPAEMAYAATATPSYTFVSPALASGGAIALSGGDGTPTSAFLKPVAAGAATTDSAPLQTTLVDFRGVMQVSQPGTYTVSLAHADDAAAFYIAGDGNTAGGGTLVVQRNWSDSITTAPNGSNPQPLSLAAGAYFVDLFYYNQTLPRTDGGAGLTFGITGPAPVTFTTGAAAPPSAPSKVQPQWFYAGACLGSVIRAEAIPGRVFYAADGVTRAEPFVVMQQAGFNAARVEAFPTDCVGPTQGFDNSGDVVGREMNFQLDWGCIDIQVQTAQRAKAHGMKVVLTLNMGFDIPVAWQGYTYAQMLQAIDGEVRRQLTPFVQAGIQPDIILLENEGTDGILYNVKLPTGESYARGTGNNPNVSAAQLKKEVCGQLPTGNMASYPQLAGYYKQEVLSSRSVLQDAGMDDSTTRFGLHSHGQYVDWKQSVVYSTNPNQELIYSGNGITCGFTDVIPQSLLALRAADMIDIMGFSSYAEPMTPANPDSVASMQDTFARLRTTLQLMDAVAQRYGKYTTGPFTGQYKKQGLGVEYASAFTYPNQIADQQQHTQIYFQTLKAYPWFLGSLWWEPTYRYNNWEGGNATLYRNWNTGTQTNEAPTATLTTWGSFASSPVAP